MLADMAEKLLILSHRDEGWAGLQEGASQDHFFRSDRLRSLCGRVVVLSSIGPLTESGGNKSCCRACNDLHSAEMRRFASLRPACPHERHGWEPRDGTKKRHFFGLAAGPKAIRASLCRNAILVRSVHRLQPGYEFGQYRCSGCRQIALRSVIVDPSRLPPGKT